MSITQSIHEVIKNGTIADLRVAMIDNGMKLAFHIIKNVVRNIKWFIDM